MKKSRMRWNRYKNTRLWIRKDQASLTQPLTLVSPYRYTILVAYMLFMHVLYTVKHSDSLRDGYTHLRGLVMAYGDISPQSPLSMMSSSQPTTQQSSTSESTSEGTTPQLNEGDQSLIDQSDPFPDVPLQPERVHSAPRSWSRSQSRSASSSRPVSGMDRSRNQTPVSEYMTTSKDFLCFSRICLHVLQKDGLYTVCTCGLRFTYNHVHVVNMAIIMFWLHLHRYHVARAQCN